MDVVLCFCYWNHVAYNWIYTPALNNLTQNQERKIMNKAELVSQIAESADISIKAANDTLQAFMLAIAVTMKKGDKVTLIGFGTFSISKRAARDGRNPQTGKAIKIPAKNMVKFKVGKKLDEAVQ